MSRWIRICFGKTASDVLRFSCTHGKKNASTSGRGIRCRRNRHPELFVSGGGFRALQHERPSKAEAHVVYGEPNVCVGGTGSKSDARCHARIARKSYGRSSSISCRGRLHPPKVWGGDRRAYPELLGAAKTRHSQSPKGSTKDRTSYRHHDLSETGFEALGRVLGVHGGASLQNLLQHRAVSSNHRREERKGDRITSQIKPALALVSSVVFFDRVSRPVARVQHL